MKKLIVLVGAALLSTACNSQEHSKDKAFNEANPDVTEQPKGSWKVNREFDENGNLTRYDSIYSWSSTDSTRNWNLQDRDSLLQSFRSSFRSYFSGADTLGYPGFQANDSLFMKGFFNDDFFESDFGRDFMDLDQIHKRMESMHREFMKRYGESPDPDSIQHKRSEGS